MWVFENEEYRKKAVLEDMLVGVVYRYSNRFTLHGGTCVWRCYKGNRFSRDVDFYFDLAGRDRSEFTKDLVKHLKGAGFLIKEKGYSLTDTLSVVVETNTKCKLDINFKYKEGNAIDYMMVDDSMMKVIGLSADALIEEKINVHIEKTQKGASEIQDLYDVWLLKDKVKLSHDIMERLRFLAETTKKSRPSNANSLSALILSGLAPSVEQMLDDINGLLNANKRDNE